MVEPGPSASVASSVWMLSAPRVKAPALPVSLPPPRIGSFNPIRRLKKTWGVSLPPNGPPVPSRDARNIPPVVRPAALPKSKIPRPSRKNSRFSGKKRLKRDRFTCASSAST